MKMRLGWLALVLLGPIFGGCALGGATGYRPVDADGGYSELQLAPDMFWVAFRGNIYTSQEQVADMASERPISP